MTIHSSHPIPISAKPILTSSPTSSSQHARPSTSAPSTSGSRPYPTSSGPTSYDGPSLSVRPSTASPTSPSSPPPPPIPAALPQSYTTQLSDLLLSAVVPGIPKTKGGKAGQSKLVDAEGRRLLTSKKEELNLTSTTQNFRKFVLKIGWLFALQDQVEQLIFWHRPSHSVVFLIGWSILSFKPHLLLLLPPIIVLSALLSPYNLPPLVDLPQHRATPVWEGDDDEETLTGLEGDEASRRSRSTSSPTRQGSIGGPKRTGSISGHGRVSSEQIRRPSLAQTHAIEERKIEANLSSVYYQNIQGIQNLMGAFSDGHDVIAPPLVTYFSPTHPLHQTFIALSLVALCLLAFFAHAIPPWVVLLPVGWGPLLVGLIPPTAPLPSPLPLLAPHLHTLHLALLNDRLPPHLLTAPRRTLSVWESQRFAGPGSAGGWEDPTWGGREVGSSLSVGAGAGEVVHGLNEVEVGPKGVWTWVVGEGWFVDPVGEWVGEEQGVDAEGWVYMNAHHQVIPSAMIGAGVSEAGMEVGCVRRRRWWRRGVRVDGLEDEDK